MRQSILGQVLSFHIKTLIFVKLRVRVRFVSVTLASEDYVKVKLVINDIVNVTLVIDDIEA